MAQYEALTGRRPQIRYSDLVTAEAPEARKRYWNQQNLNLQNQALTQNQEQFDANLELMKEQAEEQEKQANISSMVSGAGLALEAAPYVKDAGSMALDAGTSLYNSIFPAAET